MENYFLGWGTLVLINTALANIDGRSPLAYFVGSLFFGPILTLVLGVTKYDPEGSEQQRYNKIIILASTHCALFVGIVGRYKHLRVSVF